MGLLKILKNKMGLLTTAFFAQLLLAKDAFAQFTAPASSDMSRQFINQIFGGLLDGGQDAFGSSIATLNGAVLIIGGILVAYTIVAGTLGTAHDGEMLGKKFSSVWVPIRTAMGTALVLPVMSGGYCVMQAIVMWLIMQGVSLGNMIWSSYMSNPPSLNMALGTQSKKEIKKFVEDVYLANLCVESMKKGTADISDKTPLLTIRNNYGSSLTGNTYKFGDQSGPVNNFIRSQCGTIELPQKPKLVNGNVATGLSSLNSSTAVFKSPDLTIIHDKHLSGISEVVQKTQAIATRAIEPNSSVPYSELQAITDKYVSDINAAATSIMNTSNAATLTAQQGWFMAGTWATQIINQQNKINNAGRALGVASFSTIKPTFFNKETVFKYAEQGYLIVKDQRPELQGSYDSSKNSAEKTSDDSPSGLDMTGKIMKKITSFVLEIDITTAKSDTRHPIIIMTDLGNQMFDAIISGIIGAAVLSFAGFKILGTGMDLAPAFIAVFVSLAAPLLVFQGVAGMLAYIIPNTPFFIWIGIIVGWTLMVVEAIIAAPLWAVMHLHPSGDDMTGKGGNGYMLVLGLILRPALIVFGLIAAIVMSDIFGKLINLIFFDLFLSSTPDGTLGFFGVIFGTGLYAGMMMLIIKNTFAMMHSIPDQLMRWIGGGQEQLGNYANQMSEGTMQKGAAAAGAGVGIMTDRALSGASGAVSNVQQAKGIKANKDAQQLGNTNDQKHRAEQKEEGAKQKESSVDDKLGSGGAAITGNSAAELLASGGSGGGGSDGDSNSFTSVQKEDAVGKANDVLGGKDSAAATQFRESMGADMANGMNFEEAFAKNMPEALDNTYGAGAGQFASNATGGSFSGSSMIQAGEKMKKVQSIYADQPNQMSRQSKTFQAANSILPENSSPKVAMEAMDKSINHALTNSTSTNIPKDSAPTVEASQPSD